MNKTNKIITGILKSGIVVFDEPLPAPDGTRIEFTEERDASGEIILRGVLHLTTVANNVVSDSSLQHEQSS